MIMTMIMNAHADSHAHAEDGDVINQILTVVHTVV